MYRIMVYTILLTKNGWNISEIVIIYTNLSKGMLK